MLPKAWRRVKGEIYLYKGGTSGFANTGKEPFSEFYSAQVAAAMGLDHIYYSLSMWKGQLCSTCKLFTSKEISFIPASTLMDTSRITEIIAWYERIPGRTYVSTAMAGKKAFLTCWYLMP